MTSNNHVQAEALAAWAEGRLATAEAATVEAHLASCALCQETLAVFARTEPETRHDPSVVPGFSWFRWRWAVPVAAAATAAAIWVAVPDNPRQDEFQRTVAPAIEEAASPPATASSSDASAPGETRQLDARRDVAALQDRAEKEAQQPSERDQDLKSERPAREEPQAAAPQSAATAQQAPAAPEQSRFRTETTLLRAAETVVITSPNGTNFWRVLPGGVVERSTDRGTTWESALVDDPGPTGGASSPAETVCWLVGPSGRILLTTDGLRFRRLPFPEKVDLYAVEATSAISAVVYTNGVRVRDRRAFRTEDQGKTWSPVQP